MTANERCRSNELAGQNRRYDPALLRRNVEEKSALLNCLKPVDESFVIGGIDLIKNGAACLCGDASCVGVHLLGSVVILAECSLMDVSERSFDEAQQQSPGDDDSARATH